MTSADLKQLAKWAEIAANSLDNYDKYAPEASTSEWSKKYVNSVVNCFPGVKQHLREVLENTLIELDKLELKKIV